MTVGRSTRADHDTPTAATTSRMEDKIRRARQTAQTATPPTTVDPSVAWAATLLSPATAIRRDSKQPIAVNVSAPQILDGPVDVGVEPRGDGGLTWIRAEWHGTPGQQRTATVTLGRVGVGLHRVVVRVAGVVLQAGQIVVT